MDTEAIGYFGNCTFCTSKNVVYCFNVIQYYGYKYSTTFATSFVRR